MALDDFLMDRVFQPCCDRLADRVSCFDMARSATIGWGVMLVCSAVPRLVERIAPMDALLVVVACAASPLMVHGVNQVERLARRTPAANPERITGRGIRTVFLVTALFFLAFHMLEALFGQMSVSDVLSWLAGASFTFSLYARAVNVLPAKPVRREAGQFAMAGGRA